MSNCKKIQLTLIAGFFALSMAAPAMAQIDDSMEIGLDEGDLLAAGIEESAPDASFEAQLPSPEHYLAQMPDGAPPFSPGAAAAFIAALRGGAEAAGAGGPGGPGGPGGHHHGRHRGGVSGLFSGENALTDDQYEQLYQLKSKARDEMGPLRLEYSTATRQLKDSLTQESIDRSAVNKLQKKISSLKASMSDISISSKADMANVLTATQRKELRKVMLKSSMCPVMGGGRGRRHGGGGCR